MFEGGAIVEVDWIVVRRIVNSFRRVLVVEDCIASFFLTPKGGTGALLEFYVYTPFINKSGSLLYRD